MKTKKHFKLAAIAASITSAVGLPVMADAQLAEKAQTLKKIELLSPEKRAFLRPVIQDFVTKNPHIDFKDVQFMIDQEGNIYAIKAKALGNPSCLAEAIENPSCLGGE